MCGGGRHMVSWVLPFVLSLADPALFTMNAMILAEAENTQQGGPLSHCLLVGPPKTQFRDPERGSNIETKAW